MLRHTTTLRSAPQYWRAMHYKIGRRFIALDQADNIVLYANYGKPDKFGSWGPLTVSDPVNRDVKSPTGFARIVLPLHLRLAQPLEKYVSSVIAQGTEQTTAALKKRHEEILNEMAKEEGTKPAQESKSQGAEGKTHSKKHAQRPLVSIDFSADLLSNIRRGLQQHPERFRLNRFASWLYKVIYTVLVITTFMTISVLYNTVKYWVTPNARASLINIEDTLLYYPRYWASCADEHILRHNSTARVQIMSAVIMPLWEALGSATDLLLTKLEELTGGTVNAKEIKTTTLDTTTAAYDSAVDTVSHAYEAYITALLYPEQAAAKRVAEEEAERQAEISRRRRWRSGAVASVLVTIIVLLVL